MRIQTFFPGAFLGLVYHHPNSSKIQENKKSLWWKKIKFEFEFLQKKKTKTNLDSDPILTVSDPPLIKNKTIEKNDLRWTRIFQEEASCRPLR